MVENECVCWDLAYLSCPEHPGLKEKAAEIEASFKKLLFVDPAEPTIEDIFIDSFQKGQDTLWYGKADKALKMMEEVGEFSEIALFHLGHNQHKTFKEDIFGEAADVMLCVLDTLGALHMELSPTELQDRLLDALITKHAKWAAKIKAEENDRSRKDKQL
jgi:hypothetical protein